MSATHPDETTLLRSVHGDLPDRSQAALKRHLARCRPCRDQRNGTRRLHERLAGAGDSLAFHVGDPFAARPAPREAATPRGAALRGMAAALGRLDEVKAVLKAAIEEDGPEAGNGLKLDDAVTRLAASHILEEAATADPSKEFAAFAEAVANRFEGAAPEGEEEVDAVLPRAQIAAVARLLIGNWRLFCGRSKEAAEEFAAAWTALAGFDSPEHLVAWVEAGESLRRSYEGRPVAGRLLAERALATFERYGLSRGVLRARHARAVALYTAGAFRDAHREFRAVMVSKDATQLDRARAVSGAAFCLAARGRFHDAAKEYSRVRRRLKGEGAEVEQYLLQGEMKVALGTAGRWHQRGDGLAAFALPEAGGALRGRAIAVEIVRLAGEQGIEAAKSRIKSIEAEPSRGYALLYAAQFAMPKVSSDPAMYVGLAKAIASASRSLPFLKDKGPGQPICREQVVGEAQLLESSALNSYGQAAEARRVAQKARAVFAEVTDDGLTLAFADYYEGSAAGFAGEFRDASRLLGRALKGFKLFGQDYLTGRATAAIATVLQHEDRNASALKLFNAALVLLDPLLDGHAYVQLLANRAYIFLRLGRPDAARAAYANALVGARRLGQKVAVFTIRYGLASIELSRGRFEKALYSFQRIAEDARREDLPQRALSAELRAAQCLGFLGGRDQMQARVGEILCKLPDYDVRCDKAIRDLLAMTVEADFSAELVAHVVEYLEACDCGTQREYRPLKLLKGGR